MPTKYTPRRKSRKAGNRPSKPYPEFPLYAHSLGYWSKKVNKKIIHFGRWGKVVKGTLEHLPFEASWQAALAAYKARVDDAQAGRIVEFVVQPQKSTDGLTVMELCNQFLTAKLRQLEAGDIGRRMFDEYKATTDRLITQFGKSRLVDDLVAGDFEALRAVLAKQYGPVVSATKSKRFALFSSMGMSPAFLTNRFVSVRNSLSRARPTTRPQVSVN